MKVTHTLTPTKLAPASITDTNAVSTAGDVADVDAAGVADAYAVVKSKSAPSDADVDAAFARLELSKVDAPRIRKTFGANLKGFIKDLGARMNKLAKDTASLTKAFWAAAKATGWNDVKQLADFAKLAIASGQPFEVFSPVLEVASYVWKYPDEARKIIGSLKKIEQDTWKQKSSWMSKPTAIQLSAIKAAIHNQPPKSADVVIIGSGLSAAAMARRFADRAAESGAPAPNVVIIDRDKQQSREHAASLRNAGIICTAMDYVFDIDEAVGTKPIKRIQDALGIPHAEAKQVYDTLMHVMGDATLRIKKFLKEVKGVDIDLHANGTLDLARTKAEIKDLKKAAATAAKYGLDWEAVDAAYLKEHFGIDSENVAGGLLMKDSGQLHPGKLVKALFDYATRESKEINIQWDTELLGSKRAADGKGWVLETSQGIINAKDVIDAREAWAPYPWREARYSQIHKIEMPEGSGPDKLGDTNVCNGLTYSRHDGDGNFLVGSGDFPLSHPSDTPSPLASIALYAAANFRKLYPDAEFNVKDAWGGVFGRNHDDIPVAGELLDHWWVLGGNGGSGLNLAPLLAEHTVDTLLGKADRSTLRPADNFSPRRFYLLELRKDLLSQLQGVDGYEDMKLENVRVQLSESRATGHPTAPRKIGKDVVFYVDEQTLDSMNTDVVKLLGEHGVDAVREREKAKGDWLRVQLKMSEKGILRGAAPAAHINSAQRLAARRQLAVA